MKTKIKRHSRSVLSVVLAVCMLVSCMTVGLITTDAAKVDSGSTGDGTYYLYKGTSNNNLTQVGALPQNTVHLDEGNNYLNVTRSTSGWSSDYVWYSSNQPKYDYSGAESIEWGQVQNYNVGSNTVYYVLIHTSSAGDYNFTYNESNSTLTITGGTAVPTTWSVVGDNTDLFGTAWDTTSNDLTESGSSWTWTKNNVYLEKGNIEYKVVKNHAWATTYPQSGNQIKEVTASKYYNVTVTYDGSSTLTMTLADAATYTLDVPNVDGAVVKATYNGTTANEGGTLSDIPGGASVTISVTPDVGKTCTGITATPSATVNGSGKTWTLEMPNANVTDLDFTFGTVRTETVYFNNGNTMYAMVSAKYTYNGETTTATMTKLPNSNIWSVTVPGDLDEITFVGDNGYNTGSLEIPWTYTNPKYTAGTNPANPADGGTWGNYTARSNEVNVSAGTTLTDGVTAGNLFTGITATMYDYYVDGEVTNGWLNGINTTKNSREYTDHENGWKWNPFTTLNAALSDYANTKDVTYPLYFGNLNVWSDNGTGNAIGGVGHSNKDTITGYTHWNQLANGSITLNDASTTAKNAVTGLSGSTLAGSNIHYYKNGATNENGAAMAMFDEDFLSGENSQNAVLATILRASNFPVRKETRGGTTTYEYYDDRIYFESSGWWNNDSAWTAMYYWTSSGTTGWKKLQSDSNGNYFEIPPNTDGVQFVRMKSSATEGNWTDKLNQIPETGSAFTVNSDNIGKTYSIVDGSGSLSANKVVKSSTTSDGYTYYTFDSTGGRDNAYIENITKPTAGTSGTATIEYYENSNKVYSAEYGNAKKAEGFFPFDKNADQNNVNSTAHDLGFGMKLEIPFTLNAGGLLDDGVTPQTFDFSGDDDLWVFIDGKLVLDLGGEHNATDGTINFANRTVTANSTQKIGGSSSTVTRNDSFASWFDNTNANQVHTMTIYYMERGMFDSNLHFGFSFHAIPEQLQIDKKVRTYDINSGFFYVNNNTRALDGNSQPVLNDHDKQITQFEYTYQEAYTGTKKENFTIDQTGYPKDTEHNTLNYSVGNDSYTVTSSQGGTVTYDLYNDKIAYFNGQYTNGTSITFKETIPSNSLYHYRQEFSAVNLAQNSASLNPSEYQGSYSFTMPTGSGSELSDIRVRARFTNHMLAHDITLTKEVSDETDTTTPFTFEIKFKFGEYGYVAYPIDVTVDGTEAKLSDAGRINITPGQVLVLPKIPENAMVQIVEVLDDSTSQYSYKNISLTHALDQTTVTKGVQFRVGTQDIAATASNTKGDPVYISHNLLSTSTGDAYTYVSAEVQKKSDNSVVETYARTAGVITVNKNQITKNSENKIVITLDTVAKGNARFVKFWEQISATLAALASSGTKYTAVIDNANCTAVITVNISDLFTDGVQTIDTLPFYSELDGSKDLTITKKLTSGTDASTAFTVAVTLDGSAYQGAWKLNDNAQPDTTTGVFTVNQDDVITIENIPVNSTMVVSETDIPFNYTLSKITLGSDTATDVKGTPTNGYTFDITDDTDVTIWNAPITYHYSITYAYDSYRDLHKTQKYKVTGDFDNTTAKVADYLTVSDTVYDDDTKSNVTAYWFKGDNERKNFINILGPYENNFRQKLYWNTDMKSSSNSEGVSIVYSSSTHTYTIDVNVIASSQKFVDLTFKLPYNHDVRSTAYAATETDGKVLYNNALPDETISNLDYGTWFASNGVKYGESGKPQFVSAPLVIYNGNQAMGFKYWTVKTVATDLAPSVEYTKCYYHEFNLSIYQDSIVEPHYENISTEQATNYSHNAHEEAIKDGNANGAVVTFIENSRNQYNMINQKIEQNSRKNQGDRIYTDFLLSYASESDLQFQDYADGTYTAGLAIQKVALLDNDGADGKITDSAHYATKYGDNLGNMKYKDAAFDKTTLESFIKGTASYNDAIGLERSEFDANKLDNKNRIQYYYSYSVRNHQGEFVDNGNKNYVYRAFAYMKDNNSGNVTMVSQPLYFTFYDMASIANAQIGYNADFPSTPTP